MGGPSDAMTIAGPRPVPITFKVSRSASAVTRSKTLLAAWVITWLLLFRAWKSRYDAGTADLARSVFLSRLQDGSLRKTEVIAQNVAGLVHVPFKPCEKILKTISLDRDVIPKRFFGFVSVTCQDRSHDPFMLGERMFDTIERS